MLSLEDCIAMSGLTEEEIKRMVSDAEAHAEEDRKALELVNARNQCEALVHSIRKSLGEYGDKLEAGEKEKIEAALKEVEEVIKSDDKDAIEAKTNALMEASHKLAEKMYAQQQPEGEPGRSDQHHALHGGLPSMRHR